MFSSRLRHPAGRNRLARELDRRRASGLPIVDLTLSNPTRAGLSYPAGLLEPLAGARARDIARQPPGTAPATPATSSVEMIIARRGLSSPVTIGRFGALIRSSGSPR